MFFQLCFIVAEQIKLPLWKLHDDFMLNNRVKDMAEDDSI